MSLWLAAEMGSDAHVSAVPVLVVHYHLHSPVNSLIKRILEYEKK